MKYIYVVLLMTFLISCGPSCDCTEEWEGIEVTYFPGDLVTHKGECWVCENRGRAEPGPWQVNGNDVWLECEE